MPNNQAEDIPKWEDVAGEEDIPKWEDVAGEETIAEDAPADLPEEVSKAAKTSLPEAMLRGGAQGGSMGLIDEGTAGVGAAIDKLQALLGQRGDVSLKDAYKTRVNAIRNADKQAADEHPVAYTGAMIGGGVASGVGLGAAAKGGSAAAKLLTPGAKAPLKELMAKGAAQGAISGYGMSDSDTITGDIKNAAVGGAFGGAVPVAIEGIKKGVTAAGKGVAHFLGKGDVADDYLKNADKVNRKDLNFTNMQQKLDDYGSKVRGEAEDAAAALESAKFQGDVKKGAIKDAEDLYKNTIASSDAAVKEEYKLAAMAAEGYRGEVEKAQAAYKAALSSDNANISAAKKAYQEALKKAEKDYISELKRVKVGADAEEKVRGALKKLNAQGSELAQKQAELLGGDSSTLNVRAVYDDLVDRLDKRQIGGRFDPMDEEAKFLQMLKKRFEVSDGENVSVIEELSPAEINRLRQMTKGGVYNLPDGTVIRGSNSLARAHKVKLNEILDSASQGDQFKDVRSQLHENMNVLESAAPLYGSKSPDVVRKNLQRAADTANFPDRRVALEQLGKQTDTDLLSLLKPIEQARSTLNNPAAIKAEAERRALAELEALNSIKPLADDAGAALRTTEEGAKDSIKKRVFAADDAWETQLELQDAAKERLLRALGGKGSVDEALKSIDSELLTTQSAKDAARNKARSISDLITAKDGSQATIRRMLHTGPKKPEIQLKNRLAEIGKDMNEPNLVDDLDMLRIKTRLASGGPQGSRLVNVGAKAGRALAGDWGAAIGGFAGGAADFGSGKTAKLALDAARGVSKHAGKFRALTPAIIDRLVGTPYAEYLDKAAMKGSEALDAAHEALLKDPAYADMVKE